ncbi:MAG TPA: transposase [Gemmatimonadaceae bacterium]|nr:transposase [Gemmatimonadaceae bacterium]
MDATLTTVAMIQALIPLGLRAVEDALLTEVETLAGPRYARGDAHPAVVRWGAQAGSIYLADQKLPIQVPRVRDRTAGAELPLATYAALQTPRGQDVGLFRRVLGGLSCREYEAAAEAVPEAFGLTRSSVSRRFIRASAHALRRLQERPLDDAAWLVLVLDGKTFADDQLVVGLGVTTTGEKRVLGLVQTASENQTVIASFLRTLGARGFPLDRPLLAVLDGAKGLRAAVREVFGPVPIQRCQWHKRENVVRHLAKREQPTWRRKLQAAYAQPTYATAKRALDRLHRELQLVNASAAGSLAEGLEDTLTLHRLGLFPTLGVSFKTTNLIESVMARLEARTHRVTHWRTSDQKLRWCAAALGPIEQRFRRVKGYRHLPLLQQVLDHKFSSTHAAAA